MGFVLWLVKAAGGLRFYGEGESICLSFRCLPGVQSKPDGKTLLFRSLFSYIFRVFHRFYYAFCESRLMTFLSDFQELKTYNFPPGSLKDLAFIGIKLKMLRISLLLMPHHRHFTSREAGIRF